MPGESEKDTKVWQFKRLSYVYYRSFFAFDWILIDFYSDYFVHKNVGCQLIIIARHVFSLTFLCFASFLTETGRCRENCFLYEKIPILSEL